ncbi:MAG TPA: SUF system NifU family Fe-S cluster assembly protein [Aestuariivirgaceae bacterium]|nr:SUF system NifU family Fe-S cluster assembly protein [Aestuariivirgaceae bacterium]
MSELREIYQEVILDHCRAPRNCRALADASHQAEGYNPLCGDKVVVYLRVDHGVITEASFEGVGCAISTATASLMTEMLKGRNVGDVQPLFKDFRDMVTGADAAPHPRLGKLEVLGGVREFPGRVKCATLAWHTVLAALQDQPEPVSTE